MRPCAVIALVSLMGCSARSVFDFSLTGDVNERVGSSGNVSGAIDNAGHLALYDAEWDLTMSLGGIGVGSQTVSAKAGELRIVKKGAGSDVFTTANGGTCTINIHPHESNNGSHVTGTFSCKDIVSDAGKRVSVTGGEFRTLIKDRANNPNFRPPA